MEELNLKNERKKFRDKGIFYTPKEICEYMKTFFPEDIEEIYDPTCGQGNLLEVFPDNVLKYGQDISEEEVNKARQRLTNFNGVVADTLKEPAWIDRKFKYITANYPYSISWDAELLKEDVRFNTAPALAPKSKADFAFILHILYLLADDGLATVLGMPGILYRGGAEYKLRKYLIEQNYIEKVISISGDKFVDTSIATVLLVLRKNKTSTDIEFIDYDSGLSYIATFEEIKNNDFVLSPETYINFLTNEEEIDILALGIEHRDMTINTVYSMLKSHIWILKANKYLSGITETDYPEEDLKKINFIYSLTSLFDMFFNAPSTEKDLDNLFNFEITANRIRKKRENQNE